jgi:hypothetical protein
MLTAGCSADGAAFGVSSAFGALVLAVVSSFATGGPPGRTTRGDEAGVSFFAAVSGLATTGCGAAADGRRTGSGGLAGITVALRVSAGFAGAAFGASGVAAAGSLGRLAVDFGASAPSG